MHFISLYINFLSIQFFFLPQEFRAFELLRSGLDRSKYLLVKEAKIIAMTCTHAALKRHDLVELGFKVIAFVIVTLIMFFTFFVVVVYHVVTSSLSPPQTTLFIPFICPRSK